MDIDTLQRFLGWGIIFHLGILLWWFGFLVFAHDWVYRLHTRWFRIKEERFDEIHYTAFAYYKLTVFILVVVPYLSLLVTSD